jgi:hypothetical protein
MTNRPGVLWRILIQPKRIDMAVVVNQEHLAVNPAVVGFITPPIAHEFAALQFDVSFSAATSAESGRCTGMLFGQPFCLGLGLSLGPVEAARKLGDYLWLSPDNRPAVGKAIFDVSSFTDIHDTEYWHAGTYRRARDRRDCIPSAMAEATPIRLIESIMDTHKGFVRGQLSCQNDAIPVPSVRFRRNRPTISGIATARTTSVRRAVNRTDIFGGPQPVLRHIPAVRLMPTRAPLLLTVTCSRKIPGRQTHGFKTICFCSPQNDQLTTTAQTHRHGCCG